MEEATETVARKTRYHLHFRALSEFSKESFRELLGKNYFKSTYMTYAQMTSSPGEELTYVNPDGSTNKLNLSVILVKNIL